MSKDREYDFWCWLSKNGWSRSWFYMTGRTFIGTTKSGWDIEYIGLYQGKFTFTCKKEKSYDHIDIGFDTAFSDDPDKVQSELFKQLGITD